MCSFAGSHVTRMRFRWRMRGGRNKSNRGISLQSKAKNGYIYNTFNHQYYKVGYEGTRRSVTLDPP